VPHDNFTIRSFAGGGIPAGGCRWRHCGCGAPRKEDLLGKGHNPSRGISPPLEKLLLDRYSRHYYYVSMLALGPIRTEALTDTELLEQVVSHKETFYPSGWAHYELAHPGSLHLMAREERLAALERDYRNMGVMIFGEPPLFDKIRGTLAALEQQING